MHFLLFSLLMIASGNYKYEFKESCNCIMSKNNPDGITQVAVYPYDTDPEIHEHNCGFYIQTSKEKVKEFSLTDFSPKDFSCQPCFSFIPEKKYVFVFRGKEDMDDVQLKIFKDAKGVIREIK